MTISLDRADRRILFELDSNSRQSLSQLARRVRLGRDLVEYRMGRLMQQGVLVRCSAMVNPYKLGFTVYKTYLRLETNRDRVRELVGYLDRHPSTYWLAECYGEWDLIFSILARTPKDFYDFQNRLFSDFKEIIVGFNVYTLVNYWWFPKKYLLGDKWEDEWNNLEQAAPSAHRRVDGWSFQTPSFVFGTTPKQYALDSLEYRILGIVSEDARISVADLAERVGTTPSIAKYRLGKMEEMGIIAGYRADISLDAVGTTLFRVLVHVRDYDCERERDFMEYCRRHPLVSSYVQQLGDCKLEFEVEARDYKEFSSVIDEVRERFSKYIRTMDYMTVRSDYHYRTPCGLFLGDEVSAQAGELELSVA